MAPTWTNRGGGGALWASAILIRRLPRPASRGAVVVSGPAMEATPATCCSRLLAGEGAAAAAGRRRAVSLSAACRKFRRTADAEPRARRARSVVVLAASSSPSFDLSPPPIDYDGDDLQVRLFLPSRAITSDKFPFIVYDSL